MMNLFKSHLTTKVVLLVMVVLSLTVTTIVVAQEEESEPSPSTSTSDDKIQNLKDRLATKVAELRQNQTRGFYGEIASLSKTSFTLVTHSGEVKVRYSDDTQIFKDAKKTAGAAADLQNLAKVAVLGLYDEENKQHTAKIAIIQPQPTFYAGTISEVNPKDAIVTLKTPKNTTLTVDYERTTQAREYDADKKTIARSGLSRLSVGDKLFVWGTPDADDASRIDATRMLRLTADILGATTETSPTTTASPSASPRSTPRATPRATPATAN